ncbi:unnamed protein product [Mytilus coruscus]|uniref:TRIM2_3 n=1 Tax=Mytilus coruscus TaxID=42192 RepID=A0A6J8BK37_MYTCO|nr:unnamed protein product [Mytilus coruscus]
MKEHLQTVTTNSSKMHCFLSVYQIEQQVHQCQQYVDDLKKMTRLKKFDIKMKQNDEIENILIKLGSLEFLGEVMVVKTGIAVNRETSLRRKAQVQTRQQSIINNMTMNIETKIDININKQIADMICLMDGRVIVVEAFDKVILSDGKLEKQLPITGEAYSVTQINHNTIAISYPRERIIKVFNMENETVTKVFTFDKACWGLSFSNNSLAVGLSNDEIRIIDLEGNTLKFIQDQNRLHLFNIIYCNDRVYYMDYRGQTIYCVDVSGKQIWQCEQGLTGAWGFCTDTYGNIILADCFSSSITVISKDGQNSKELISKEDGLVDLTFICFKPNESSGLICDYKGTYLAKFNLSSG